MLKASVLTSISENNFIRQALYEGIRLDGRILSKWRNIDVNISRSEASSTSEVVIGGTRVLAIVQCQVTKPYPDRSSEGILHINTELSVFAEISGISDNEIRRILEKTIRESDTIDLESLCIVSGEKVWKITIDIRVIDYFGGNIIDAAVFAALSALRAFRKPDVSIESIGVEEFSGKNKTKLHIYNATEREPLPLALHHTPLSATIGLFKLDSTVLNQSAMEPLQSDYLIFNQKNYSALALVCDPSIEEERVMDGRITFSLNAHKELCSIYKPGSVAIDSNVVLTALRIASTRIQDLQRILQESLNQLEERVSRDKIILMEQLRKYRSQVDVFVTQKKTTSLDIEDDESQDVSHSDNIGIDKDDPMLAWSNLHKPAISL